MDAKVREEARNVARKAGVEAFENALLSAGRTTGVDAFGAALDAYEAALKAAGYVMVPREPTEAMVQDATCTRITRSG